MGMSTKPIQVIIPTITKDYLRMRHLQPERVLKYLPVSELIFVGNSELCDIVNGDIDTKFRGLPVRTLHEEELVERQSVIDFIRERVRKIDEELLPDVRCGWYYQQFLKMAFSNICDGEYYMSWDMDTVPLRETVIFDNNGRPVFGLKNEHNPGYFKTIGNLLGLKKNTDGSFISEHMVFGKRYMKELIEAINSSPVKGRTFWEKIVNAVDDDYISLGFSEFETYGVFITDKYPDVYGYRRFESFRRGSWFIKEGDIREEDLKWLAADYDAVTFENADVIPEMAMLFRNPKYRDHMTARKFYETILESGYFGEYSNGRINAGDWFAPV